MSRFRPPGDCPNCGETVPLRAVACPHCGATHEAGWDDNSIYDGLDLPDEAYEDGEETPTWANRKQRRGLWIGAAILVLAALTSWIWMR